jgi:hypothetical protein
LAHIEIIPRSDIVKNMRVETVTDFLRHAKSVLRRIDKEDVVLSRRGRAPIRISLEARNASAMAGLGLAADVLAALVAVPEVPPRLPAVLEQRFPWVRFFPDHERERFTREFVETLQACASIGKSARLEELVTSWKSTATIYADPALAADLKRPLPGTGRMVRRP